MKILYIHGFSSSGNATKANILRKHFGESKVIAPTLPVNPIENLELLDDIIDAYENKIFVIGSSLGGFYANYLQKKHNLPCLLLNPSVQPHITLKIRIGLGVHFRQGTNEKFELTEKHIEIFKELFDEVNCFKANPKLLNIIICKNDDLLDHSKTLELLKEANSVKVLKTGGHTMTNFESQIPYIKRLIMNYL